MKRLGRIVLIIGLVLALLVSVMLLRALRLTSRQMEVAPASAVTVDSQEIAGRLTR